MKPAIRLGAILLFVVVVVAPAVVWLAGSVIPGGAASSPIFTILSDARQFELLGNTLLLGFSSAAASLLIGMPVGFLVSRTDVPFGGFFYKSAFMPLLLPPLVHAIAWTGLTPVRGCVAAIGIFTISCVPVVILLTARAMERMDRRMEEAALLAGGRRLQLKLLFRMSMPSALAGALCVFVFSISDFSVTDYLSSIGPKFSVYADEIFTRWQRENAAGPAMAAAIPVVALTMGGVLAIRHLTRRGATATLRGQFQAPAKILLKSWRAPVFIILLIFSVVSWGAAVARLAFVAESFANIRLALWQAQNDILTTLLSSAGAAVLATLLALVLAHFAARGPSRAAAAMETSVILPFAIPAIALAVALIRVWNHDGLPGMIYDSIVIVMIAILARYFIFAWIPAAAGVRAMAPSLEESATLAGVPFFRHFIQITARLAAPALAVSFTFVFILGVRELDTIVLIPAGNHSVLFRVYNAIHFNRPQFVAALCFVIMLLTGAPLLLFYIFGGGRARSAKIS